MEEGQLLATLDATFAEADVTASRAILVSIEAQARRLAAEMSKKPPQHFSDDPSNDALQWEIFGRRCRGHRYRW